MSTGIDGLDRRSHAYAQERTGGRTGGRTGERAEDATRERGIRAPEAPLNDIVGLAQHVPEIDPERYLDAQARQAYEQALDRWPLLARLMGLVSGSA
jgi:hypothetical protein